MYRSSYLHTRVLAANHGRGWTDDSGSLNFAHACCALDLTADGSIDFDYEARYAQSAR